jgi:hypothetical protein
MGVLQFNGNYQPQEDRLIFRFNTATSEEYRLFLTRATLKQLFHSGESVLQAQLASSYPTSVAPAVNDFQNTAVAQQSDFQSTFKPGEIFPLGESPILVVAIQVSEREKNVSIDFQLATKQNLNIKIPQANFRALMILLKRLQAEAGWGLDDVQVTSLTNPQSQANQLH